MIAFVNGKDALHTARYVSVVSKVNMGEYKPVMAEVTEDTSRAYVNLQFQEKYNITFSKDYTPQWEWLVETISTENVFQYPLTNTGVIIADGQVEDTADTITFKAYVLEPLNNPTLYRIGLMQQPLD